MMRITLAVATAAFVAVGSHAGVSAYTSNTSEIVNVTNTALFDDIVTNTPLQNYTEDGLRVHIDDFAFGGFTPPGFDGSGFWYPNGGVTELGDITKTDGTDFDSIDFQVSHGFGGNQIWVWMQVYNDGGLIAEFDFDVIGGTYIGVTGGGFDQILVGSYADGATRDEHDPANLNAIAIDNMNAGIIPAPGALAVLGLAGLTARRRRR